MDRNQRPLSALSASLGGTSRSTSIRSNAGSSVPPSVPVDETLEEECLVPASTLSRSFLGMSPLSQQGEWGRCAPRGSSGGTAVASSLGTSFKAGHSFMMNTIDRRRPPSAAASLSHGDSGALTAPLLQHQNSYLDGHAGRAGSSLPHRAPSATHQQPPHAAAGGGSPPPLSRGVYAAPPIVPPPAVCAGDAMAVSFSVADEDLENQVMAAAAAADAAADAAAAAAVHRSGDGKDDARRATFDAVVYGLINAIVGVPCMIAFANVIFSDPMYKPMIGELARFSFLAAAMHQAAFTMFSSLPFAVGQPQDVGLIFLSSMATGVAEVGRQMKLELAEVTGTALLTIMVATIVVGVLTTLVAKFKLATLVQYVPLPVVGGYLGYVGYFCLAAGVGLGAGVQIGSFSSWLGLFTKDALIKSAPTLASSIVLMITMTRARSPWALPAVLVALPAAFHLVLLATGTTLEQAQDAGWALKPEGKSTQQFWELYSMFNIKDMSFDGVYLPALVRQLPKILGLFFVVTFGSCLDVAAIQADVPHPIDFNRELATVGLSNIMCGLAGCGYTGSYIFSQTIFSMRAGVENRLHGVIIATAELGVFLLPFSVAQYLPLYYYGALLGVFGIEIAGDWLVRSRHKVTRAEYLLLLATFLAIMQFELEMGVLVGVVLCLVYFAATYAHMNMTAFAVLPPQSVAARTYRERHLLEAFRGRSVAVGLSGYVFFGSSVLLTEKVSKLAQDMVDQGADAARAILASTSPPGHPAGAAKLPAPLPGALGPPPAAAAGGGGGEAGAGGGGGEWDGVGAERLAALVERAPCFVLLDFRRVLGVDATAAQLLGSLRVVLRQLGVELVLTRVRDDTIWRLLVAHGLLAPSPEEDDGITYCRAFPTLSLGEQYAEDRFLAIARGAGLLGSGEEALSLKEFLLAHVQEGPLSHGLDVAAAADGISRHSATRRLSPGDLLFEFDGPPDEIFLVLSGAVDVAIKHFSDPVVDAASADMGGGHGGGGAGGSPAAAPEAHPERHYCCGPGSVFGGTDFVLQRPRTFRAAAAAPSTVVAVSKEGYRRMAWAAPQAAAFLQMVLLRDACLSEVYAYEVLERALLA